jgi:hypothetical protein
MAIKVKEQYLNTEIGFNNSSAPLGKRNDLHLLLRDAKASKHQAILNMFEEVSDEQLLEEHGKAFEKKQEDKKLR